ncbi:MAG: hypothetical protein ACLROI_14685 [Beduini sp.]|uniref:hypothetical protein n=1 Tax=Beduini sp. TaxID=1922300 RepID=UPI003990D9F9
MKIIKVEFNFSLQEQINNKKRKILGYISAEESFKKELIDLGLSDAFCFYA